MISIQTVVMSILNKTLDPKKLTVRYRRKCVEYLCYDQNKTIHEAAFILQTTEPIIKQDRLYIKRGINKQLEIEEPTFAEDVVKDLRFKKNLLQRKAMSNGDLSLYWKIETDYLEKMQDLGIIKFVPKPSVAITNVINNTVEKDDSEREFANERDREISRQMREWLRANTNGNSHKPV